VKKLHLISGKVDSYQNEKYIHIGKIGIGTGNVDEYIKSLNCDELYASFVQFINSEMSAKALLVLDTLFSDPEYDLYNTFKYGYAATGYHDAIRGGLLNHTFKGMKIIQTLMANDSRLEKFKDLLYLGFVLHDAGKVKEMEGGAYRKNTFVTHRILGVELISKYKTVIVANFDEDFYYRLLSIIVGHHDEFEDKARTLVAFILHQVDMVESQTTFMMDSIEDGKLVTTSSGEKAISTGGRMLVI
jgi:3'-5' exoribonuclease